MKQYTYISKTQLNNDVKGISLPEACVCKLRIP